MPEGLAILSAAPKVGKTLLATSMAACVASGRPFMGYDTNQCDVLYIDAESDERGVKHRLRAIQYPQGVDGLQVSCMENEQLDDANLKHLQHMVEKNPRLKLIIIDTLERLIPHPAGVKGLDAYQQGVKRLSGIQSWARKNQLCVLLIHHTKKGASTGENYDATSGSRSMTGTPETIMMLKRNSGDTFILSMTSRYAAGLELAIQRTGAIWELLGDPAASLMTPDQVAVRDYLADNPKCDLKVMANNLDIKKDTVQKICSRLTKCGILDKVGRGRYEIHRNDVDVEQLQVIDIASDDKEPF